MLPDSKDVQFSVGGFLGWVGLGGGGQGRGFGSLGEGGGCWGGAEGAERPQPTTGQHDLLMSTTLPPQLIQASTAYSPAMCVLRGRTVPNPGTRTG